jgi:hypothetical protein
MTYAPPCLRSYVRIPVELTWLKPEAAKNLCPRRIGRNKKSSRETLDAPAITHWNNLFQT